MVGSQWELVNLGENYLISIENLLVSKNNFFFLRREFVSPTRKWVGLREEWFSLVRECKGLRWNLFVSDENSCVFARIRGFPVCLQQKMGGFWRTFIQVFSENYFDSVGNNESLIIIRIYTWLPRNYLSKRMCVFEPNNLCIV